MSDPWDELAPHHREKITRLVHGTLDGVDPAEHWRAMAPECRREWIWHEEHGHDDVEFRAWDAEQRRLAEQADPEATAFLNATGFPDETAERERRREVLGALVTTRMSDVVAEEVRWLWPGRIPLGKMTILEGDPKEGKSTMALDWVARVTTGALMPDGSPSDLNGPANCVLMTAEDGLADTVRPRLDLAGADANRVVVWEAVLTEHDDQLELRLPSLPLDVSRLEALVFELAAKLVIVDVLAAYLGARVDTHHDADVRRALAPLAKMAERTGAAVVVLRHITKGSGGKALYRGGGSIGISGQARSILLAGPDPDDETRRRRVLAVTACNLAATAPSLSYELVAESQRAPVRIAWTGSSSLSADDLLVDPGSEDERSGRKEIADLLTSWTEDGPVPVEEVRKRLRVHGLRPSDSTLRRARSDAGVQMGSPDGFGGQRHYWRPHSPVTAHEVAKTDWTVATPLTRENNEFPGPVQSDKWVTGLDSENPLDGDYES